MSWDYQKWRPISPKVQWLINSNYYWWLKHLFSYIWESERERHIRELPFTVHWIPTGPQICHQKSQDQDTRPITSHSGDMTWIIWAIPSSSHSLQYRGYWSQNLYQDSNPVSPTLTSCIIVTRLNMCSWEFLAHFSGKKSNSFAVIDLSVVTTMLNWLSV